MLIANGLSSVFRHLLPLMLVAFSQSAVSSPTRLHLNETQLSFHPSDNSNGIGVLVVPGGGYSFVSIANEGTPVVEYLNDLGYDAWLLKYSTAEDTPTPLYPIPQEQALAAVSQIRAQNYVSKLGIWGFSAGGHLSATTLTNPEADLDFGILAYPVITMDPAFTHPGSRANLIGQNASVELQRKTSAEDLVSDQTPPVFLFHTANDNVVPVKNSLVFAGSMASHNRSFSQLIVPEGRHGLVLGDDASNDWSSELERWLDYSIRRVQDSG